ncbi:MAG: 2-methylfumaryl-CoA isomerase [Verrucomicrobiales bacterium]|jgi:2-methylfumaryl-CoA isomerase
MVVPPLEGMRIIEGSAFIAAPSGGMTLAQLGADVIRFDQIGGGIDFRRWPLTPDGDSLYWAGLNKNKRSLAVDLRSPEAQELLGQLIADAGNFITNFPAKAWMTYDALAAERADLNMIAITGNRDGSTALDYTVNAAIGFPFVTGPVDDDEPVNNVLPAWDLICGQTAALGMLAADRHRFRTGEGSNMSVALFDVALAAVSAMGHVGEAQVLGTERQRFGNDLYGAFGAMFSTIDGERVYAVGISGRQWRSLLEAADATGAVGRLADELGVDFADEGARFAAREEIKAIVQSWTGERTLAEVSRRFDELGVCWGRYQHFLDLVRDDPRCSTQNELFREVEQPRLGTYLSPGSPVAFDGLLRVEPSPAPRLGAHTEAVLAELGLTQSEIGSLIDKKVVAAAPDD